MRAEIVSIGSELLLGQIVDTNAAVIARHFAALGLDLFQKVTVGDNLGRVTAALETALARAEVVVTTGGLGPTEDDVTREAVARATGRALVFQPQLLEDIEGFFRARGLVASPSNRKQAYIPAGALAVPNPVGTAPCFILEDGGRTLAVLPGVPREMEYLLTTRVIPHLRSRYRGEAVIVSRLLRVVGLGESRVGEILADFMAKGANPTVGTMAHPGQVDVRIAAKATDEGAARALIAPVEAAVRARLGETVFGTDGDTLEGVVAQRLVGADRRLALLEVGTGGLVTERLTSVPGAGDRVEAMVAPLPRARQHLHAASATVAGLAEAVRAWAGADVGAAVVVGPPEAPGPNPVHPTRTAVATAEGTSEAEHRPGGDLRQVRLRAQLLLLDHLRRALAPPG
ncbi:MAG TPA: CinA family nicotinamide mononucleotide deamidase-related protein [Methylomirabilota bacterium]|nr:CinA family nicotinamide mononucleotide deamidase-related protein [Methylomirabilota bacterium]